MDPTSPREPIFSYCLPGASHKLLPLDELVTYLVKDDIQVEMMAKEDKLESLFKLASKAASEYDAKTTEMIQLLHNTRDEQVGI
jgi:hypothetical protein